MDENQIDYSRLSTQPKEETTTGVTEPEVVTETPIVETAPEPVVEKPIAEVVEQPTVVQEGSTVFDPVIAETSNSYSEVEAKFKDGRYTTFGVRLAVIRGEITPEDYTKITGEEYELYAA